jgi:5-methylcytosine-specific restriction endonuclease McrA
MSEIRRRKKVCLFIPSRGKNKGIRCDKEVIDGESLCSKHFRKEVKGKLREELYFKYNSEKKLGVCYTCGGFIKYSDFEAGHIIPNVIGGETSLENLRPVCSLCNKRMGSNNMFEWAKKNGLKGPYKSELKSSICIII